MSHVRCEAAAAGRRWRTLTSAWLLVAIGLAGDASGDDSIVLSAKATDQGAAVYVNDQLFTEYLTRSGTKPVLWPVIGPTGKPMTRAYPMQPAGPHERDDHIHHRSFWFTQEHVGGANFWHEPKPGQPISGHTGETVHREFVEISSDGGQALIVTRNDWRSAEGHNVCEDRRTLRFAANADQRWIDFEVQLSAPDQDLQIGDSKEGTFGVRVAGTMKVDAELGGQIVNDRGQTNANAWGQPANWVDYHGPVDGETVGIAILSHPSNFRPTPRWHVRTYGLFTANPFGEKPFPKIDGYRQGPITIRRGDSLTLRYRVLLHLGDEKVGRVAQMYEDYSGT